MDNFKRPNRGTSRHHAVDGFAPVRKSSVPHSPRPSIGGVGQPLQQQRLDTFRHKDGFLPTTQSLGGSHGDTKAPLQDNAGMRGSKRKHRPKTKRSPLRRVGRVFAIFLVLAVLGVGGYAGFAYLKVRQVFKGGGGAAALEENVDPVKLKGEGDGRINILMLGIGGEGHEGAYLTDTIIIASVDPVQNEAALLSVPRDLWVKREDGSSGKINEVFAYARESALAKTKDKDAATKAGANATQKVLTNVLGIPMNYYVVVDFTGFQKAIDTVGGVQINVTKELTVSETLWNPMTGKNYVLNVKEGLQDFDGQKALFYARSRYTSPRGDFDRAERQKSVVIAFKEKVQSAGTYANPVKVTQLLSAFGDHVRTDMSINEVMRLYDIGKNITPEKVASIGLADPPNVLITGENINGLSAQVPKAGTYNYADIQNFVRNQLRDAFIKKENASILILNGTAKEGLASSKATELRSYGYLVSGTGNGPNKDFATTVIVDMRNGEKKYTKNYLEKRFGVSATTQLPDPSIVAGTADFVIILGTDAITQTAQ